MFFCFKQKTAYESRISDWSSDVFSSDLDGALDFVINIASFQEMSREQVSAYLDVIDRKASGLLYTQQLWSSGTHAYELGEIRGWEDYPWSAHWSKEQTRSAVW